MRQGWDGSPEVCSVEIPTVMNTNTFLSHHFFPSHSSGLKSRISLAEKPEDAESQSMKERVQPWGGGQVEGSRGQCREEGKSLVLSHDWVTYQHLTERILRWRFGW